MPESARSLIQDLSEALWPLLESEGDRHEWLDLALADLPELRGDIDWGSGRPRAFTRTLVTGLLTRQSPKGREALLNLIKDIEEGRGTDWTHRLRPLRTRVEGFAPQAAETPAPPPALQTLRHRLLAGTAEPEDLELEAGTIQEILRYRPRDLAEYRLARIAEWSQPRYALDKRFVQLTLLLDQGEEAQGPRFARQDREFDDLGEVLAAMPDPAFVLLGAPGSGKSTLLRRLEWDTARAVMVDAGTTPDPGAPLSFFISLNGYRAERPHEPLPRPLDWLSTRWGHRFPELPPLEALLEAGRMTLLLDALNEIPYPGPEPVRRWKGFLAELGPNHPGNRVIFSCRSLDYSASLSSTELPVPQVRIKPLSDPQIKSFLGLHCEAHAEKLWENLEGTPQLDLLRTPYYLKLLIEAAPQGEIPKGRAALFTGFVRQAMRREVLWDNPLFRAGELLAERDRQRLEQARRWRTPHELPSRGILIDRLCTLAYAMQERYEAREGANTRNAHLATPRGTEAAQVRIDYDEALEILDHARDVDILKAGEALGVLDEDLETDEVLYRHQLLQEYFAGRRLAQTRDPGRVRVDWETKAISPTLDETLARIADADPLPPLPGTGWEETTVLAAAMARDIDGFVADLMRVNLPLAGRCAAQPDVTLGEGLRPALQQALIGRTGEPRADLRARLAAGLTLGELGDPRLERRSGPDGDCLLPPLVDIPGGAYTLGSDEGYFDDERPVHSVELRPFRIGRFPVTNAEWALFKDAGGYEDERWWLTEEDRAWRRGELGTEGPKRDWRAFREARQADFETWRTSQLGWTSVQIEAVQGILRMSDEEFEAQLDAQYPAGRQTAPAFWDDDAFNNPGQPVVGIGWYEARAYCVWLSAHTGQGFRLPTEAEWEAAARGRVARRFAYGDDFDAARGNTYETHIRRTTPIGVFPGGETPETGLADMSGNVWEWTSSLYRPYPYVPTDGREDPVTGDGGRVVRGGSWRRDQVNARAAFRSGDRPGNRNNSQGFRLVCSSPIA
jgi:formylglycine-generating enzyme required for sulfatase activity